MNSITRAAITACCLLLGLTACGDLPQQGAQAPWEGATYAPTWRARPAPENTRARCSDGRDNDGDGYTDCRDYDCRGQWVCGSTIRVASYNVQYLDSPADDGFKALASIIRRVGADVICLQEVKDWEASRLQILAQQTGYKHYFQGRISTPMAGGLTNACLSRMPLVRARSRSSDDISVSSSANETGRDIVTVRVRATTTGRHLLVVNAHLKSGFKDADRVRRQVETYRVRDIVRRHLQRHPSDAVVVLGDFNVEVDEWHLGRVYTKPPYGMPYSYKLGPDVSYPITYHPFDTLKGQQLRLTSPTHEDTTSEFGTRIPSRKRIDFILYRGARLLGDEVYEACQDNGKDDAPKGNYLAKKGSKPVACGTSREASDHRPVLADFQIY